VGGPAVSDEQLEFVNDLEALERWPARVDLAIQVIGGAIACVGGVLVWVANVWCWFADSLWCEWLLFRGMQAASVGAIGVAYGLQVGAGGWVETQWGPLQYSVPTNRLKSAVLSILGCPLWGMVGIAFVGAMILLAIPLGIVTIVERYQKRRDPPGEQQP
jgi:hypothetical protein